MAVIPLILLTIQPTTRTAKFNAAGTRIVYMSDVDDPMNHDFDIMIMNADGSNPVNLTRHRLPDSDPSFSPDGGTVCFHFQSEW